MKHVLVVDDDEAVRGVIVATLETIPNVAVSDVANPHDARLPNATSGDSIASLPIGQCPRCPGIEFARCLRELSPKEGPGGIILITANNMEQLDDDTERAAQGTVNAIFHKPFLVQKLRQSVISIIGA